MYGYHGPKTLYAIGVIAGILIVVIGYIVFNRINGDSKKETVIENQVGIVQTAAEHINNRDFDIMFYGDELGAPDNLIVRRIYGFQHDTVFGVAARPNCTGHMIIINDQHGTVNIDPTQLNDLVARVKEDRVVLVYLGDAKLDMFDRVDIGPGSYATHNPDGGEVKSFIVCGGGHTKYTGVADDDQYLPGQLRQYLAEEQIPVYSMIMNLDKTQTYDNVWK